MDSSIALNIVLNKLLEERRFAEVAKMGRKCLSYYENKGTSEFKVIRHEFVKIYSNALLELNDSDALDAAKRCYQLLKSTTTLVLHQEAAAFFCLAIEQVA